MLLFPGQHYKWQCAVLACHSSHITTPFNLNTTFKAALVSCCEQMDSYASFVLTIVPVAAFPGQPSQMNYQFDNMDDCYELEQSFEEPSAPLVSICCLFATNSRSASLYLNPTKGLRQAQSST